MHGSESSEEDSEERSPPRGRLGNISRSSKILPDDKTEENVEDMVDAQIDVMMEETSKNSGE